MVTDLIKAYGDSERKVMIKKNSVKIVLEHWSGLKFPNHRRSAVLEFLVWSLRCSACKEQFLQCEIQISPRVSSVECAMSTYAGVVHWIPQRRGGRRGRKRGPCAIQRSLLHFHDREWGLARWDQKCTYIGMRTARKSGKTRSACRDAVRGADLSWTLSKSLGCFHGGCVRAAQDGMGASSWARLRWEWGRAVVLHTRQQKGRKQEEGLSQEARRKR